MVFFLHVIIIIVRIFSISTKVLTILSHSKRNSVSRIEPGESDQPSRLCVLSEVRMRGRDAGGLPMSLCWRKAGFLSRILRMLYLIIHSTQLLFVHDQIIEVKRYLLSLARPPGIHFYVPRNSNYYTGGICEYSSLILFSSQWARDSESALIPRWLGVITLNQRGINVDSMRCFWI